MLVKQLVANPFQHCSSVDLKSEDKNGGEDKRFH